MMALTQEMIKGPFWLVFAVLEERKEERTVAEVDRMMEGIISILSC